MNSKERVLAAIRHRETDRLPIAFMAREEVVQALCAHFQVATRDELLECLHVDLRRVNPAIKYCASPLRYADPTVRVATDPASGQHVYYDLWGVGFMEKRAAEGSYLDLCDSPLKERGTLADLESYPFPTPELWDYSVLPAQLAPYREYCVWAHSRGFFEISWFLRGMDNFLLDLLDNVEYAENLMDRVLEYLLGRAVRILEAAGPGGIDFFEYNDDVGGQNGLLLSPRMWRRFIKPRMQRLIDRVKEFGVYVRYHSCGGIREIIPDLIEIGVDILNPVQPLARGMVLSELKQEFGDRLTFDGGIDTQELLPHARGAEFERSVSELLSMMGRGGGYIMSPAHALQVDVPLENVLTLPLGGATATPLLTARAGSKQSTHDVDDCRQQETRTAG